MFGARKRLENVVENSFGKNPLEGFSFYNAKDRMENVKRFHNQIAASDTDNWQVDEITWNDLEMDEVFLRINHTNSFIGEQMLYHRLHMLTNGKNINQRKKLEERLEYLEKNTSFRQNIEIQLHHIKKMQTAYYLPEFLLNADICKIGKQFIYHVLQLLLLFFFVMGCAVNDVYFVGLIIVASVNLGIYAVTKQKYDVYFSSLIELKNIYEFCKWMQKKDKEKVFISASIEYAICKLEKMSKAIVGMSQRQQMSMSGDMIATINEYLWGIFLVDVSAFNNMMKIIVNHYKEVNDLMFFAGEVDADIAILSYRQSLDYWCKPKFAEHGINYKAVVHPLINSPVENDFKLFSRAVITGTNASGKSTFMKSVAINTILAQTINTCLAEEVTLAAMPVVSCMALRDDILTGESYYFREAKCLKRILDLARTQKNVLIIIDEILKGTNTKERVAASKAILDFLGKTKSVTIVATHDYELTQNQLYENYHFNSVIEEDDIVFDYRIHKGICESSNAIALLSYLGYPRNLVERAQNYLNENR